MTVEIGNPVPTPAQSGDTNTDQARWWQIWNYFSRLSQYFSGGANAQASPQAQANESLYYQQQWNNLLNPYVAPPSFYASQVSPADRTELYKLQLQADVQTRLGRLSTLEADLKVLNEHKTLSPYFERVKAKLNDNSPGHSRWNFGAALKEKRLRAERPQFDALVQKYSFALNQQQDNSVTPSKIGWNLYQVREFLTQEVSRQKFEIQQAQTQLAYIAPELQLAYPPLPTFPRID